jgi:hypothetical protein
MDKYDRTFVGPTGHKNFSLYIQFPTKTGVVDFFDSLTKPDATLGMCILIYGRIEHGFLSSANDPFRRSEVHVSLTQVDTILRQIGRTGVIPVRDGRVSPVGLPT